MKYNEKELAALACEGGSDKEGLLYKKGGQKGQSEGGRVCWLLASIDLLIAMYFGVQVISRGGFG